MEVSGTTPAIQELGVGINLMPHAVACFDEIGMLPVLEQSGIAPAHLFYLTGQGLMQAGAVRAARPTQ
jgi:2-polyprenyl-6-methoxyphenol hydroxylase-like FAD-dependent oxidoreductase